MSICVVHMVPVFCLVYMSEIIMGLSFEAHNYSCASKIVPWRTKDSAPTDNKHLHVYCISLLLYLQRGKNIFPYVSGISYGLA